MSSSEQRESISFGCRDRAACRCPDPAARHQLVNAACFLVPDDDARGNIVTHGLSWFRPRGRTSSKRGCARALYYLAPGVLVIGGTSEAREGGKLPCLC